MRVIIILYSQYGTNIYACSLVQHFVECFDNHCTQNDFTTIEICTYYEKVIQ